MPMRPEDLLPDHINQMELQPGVVIRKGTVGAFLINAELWCNSSTGLSQREVAKNHMLESLPALRALGLFKVLAVRDPALRALLEAS